MIDNVLEKQENENDFEHHKRLVYGKLKDKTLADYDYGEIAKYLYGKELAPDETRKRMYGSCKTLEILDELSISNITDGDILSELDAKKIELQKERQRFFDQRREFNKLVNKEGRTEHLYETLMDAANKLPESIGSLKVDVLDTYDLYDDSEAILCLSDWHYGMVANNIFNEYNTNICRERVRIVIQDAIKRIQLHKCRRLKVLVIGDVLHGSIHTSARVASEELVADQLMQVSEILAQAIIMLSQYVEALDVYMTYGNHARTVANKKDSIHHDNIERIIPWWLEQRIAAEHSSSGVGNNIVVHNDNEYEFIWFESCGHTFCASHGDLDSVKTAPRQLGVLFNKMYGVSLEYIILGDKHHNESFEELGIEAMICGALCGADEYANNKRLYSKPSQLLLIVNPHDGVDAKYELRCDYI